MRRISARITVIGIIAVFASCATPAPQPGTPETDGPGPGAAVSSFDLRPRGGQPVFLGVSNRRRDRDEEVDVAAAHVAEQASRYLRMAAVYQYVTQRGTDGFGYLDNVDTSWSTDAADQLVEDVEILESRQVDDGTLVLATVAGLPPAPEIPSAPLQSDDTGRPAWVSRPPQIPGYLVAVGSTRRSRTLRDTIDNADQEALKALLIQAGSTLRMVEDRRSVEQRGTTNTITSSEEAEATLLGFAVVARYASADGRYHYSLAIAREE